MRMATNEELIERIESLQARADSLAAANVRLLAGVEEQCHTIEALTMGVENLEGTTPILIHMARQDARISELEAAATEMADAYAEFYARGPGHDEFDRLNAAEKRLRSLLRITHEEERGNG